MHRHDHDRKNWKRRYFQLQASRLLYYKDESRSKLKGEVLLFHQSVKVHYVDIRLSGRENTFSVHVGREYSLMLQADSSQDREDWIYAIEDALLCRDSYRDDKDTQQRRDDVLRRRSISADVLQLQLLVRPTTLVPGRAGFPLAQSQQFFDNNMDKNRIGRFIRKFQTHYYSIGLFSSHSVEQRGKEFFKLYRHFIDQLVDKTCDLARVEVPKDESIDSVEEWHMRLRDAVLREVERLTFIPLQELVYHLLDDITDDLFCKAFERKKQWLSQKTQRFFDISETHVSPSYYEGPIALLNSLDSYSLPCEKSAVLVQVAHAIAVTFEHEHGRSCEVLAADDFLPIFVFVLCNCSLKNLVITRGFLSETMINAIGMGEKGYYVTMLEAAVEYIASFSHPELPVEIANVSPIVERKSTGM